MENRYWTGRNRAARAMADNASTAEARLIHYELAGRYSIKAAHCLPFAIAAITPAGDRREALRPAAPSPRSIDGPDARPPARDTPS